MLGSTCLCYCFSCLGTLHGTWCSFSSRRSGSLRTHSPTTSTHPERWPAGCGGSSRPWGPWRRCLWKGSSASGRTKPSVSSRTGEAEGPGSSLLPYVDPRARVCTWPACPPGRREPRLWWSITATPCPGSQCCDCPAWLPLDLGQGILVHLSPCRVGPMQGRSTEVTGDFCAFSLWPGVPSCNHEPSLVLSLGSHQGICSCVSGALVFLFYLLTTCIKCKLWSHLSLVGFDFSWLSDQHHREALLTAAVGVSHASPEGLWF